MTIFEINQSVRDIEELIEVDEISEEDAKDTLEALAIEWNEKVDAICYLVKENEAMIEAIKKEEETLKERRKTKETAVERLKALLAYSLTTKGKKSEETAKNKVSVRITESVEIKDTELFNAWAVRYGRQDLLNTKTTTTVSPDKKAIKEAIENGESIEAAVLMTNYKAIIK